MAIKNIAEKASEHGSSGHFRKLLMTLPLLVALNTQAQNLPKFNGNVGLDNHDKHIVDSLTTDEVRAHRFDPSLVDFVHQTEQEIGASMVLSQLDATDLTTQDKLYEEYTQLLDQLYNGHKSEKALMDALLTRENMLAILQRWSEHFVTLTNDVEKKESFRQMFYVVGYYAYETSYAGGSYDGQGNFHTKMDTNIYDDAQEIVHRAEKEDEATSSDTLLEKVYNETDSGKVFNLMKEFLNESQSLQYYLKLPIDNVLEAISEKNPTTIYNACVKLATVLHRGGDIDTYISKDNSTEDRMHLMQKLRGVLPLFQGEELSYIETLLRKLNNPQDAFGSTYDDGAIDGVKFSDLEEYIIDANFSGDHSYLKQMGDFRRIDAKHADMINHLADYTDEEFDMSGLQSVDMKTFGRLCDAIQKNENITTVIINPSLIMTVAQLRDMKKAPDVMQSYLKHVSKLFKNGRHVKIVGDYSGMGQDYEHVGTVNGAPEPVRERGSKYEYYLNMLLDMAGNTPETALTYEADVLAAGELDAVMSYAGDVSLPYLVEWSPGVAQTQKLVETRVDAHPDGGTLELGITQLSNKHLRAIITAIRDRSQEDPQPYTIRFSRLDANSELTHIADLATKYVNIVFGSEE